MNVLVIGWFRSPLEAFVSNHNQTIKRHFSTKRLDDICESLPLGQGMPHFTGRYLLDWADLLGDGNCYFIPYDDNLRLLKTSIEKQWLMALGVEKSKFNNFSFSNTKVNSSYLPEALELKRLLNYVLDESLLPVCLG
jgi:hypothetical protein